MTKVSIELLRTGFKQDTVTCDISKNSNFEEDLQTTASKYEVISGPYFPAFGLNMERYEVSSVFNPNAGKYGPNITPYLNTFHAVAVM